jgi:hypothetical protein
MWLVLCSAQDVSALWAFQGLQLRGLRPIELVTAEMLPYSLKWEHTLGASDPSISITLVDGRVIKNGAVRGVLNRLTHVPLQHLAGAPDYDYAMQEYTAFFMSWLFALPQPVLNRADAQGLCGAWRHISEWVWLAGRAGLPTTPYRGFIQRERQPSGQSLLEIAFSALPFRQRFVRHVFGWRSSLRQHCSESNSLRAHPETVGHLPERHPCPTCAWAVNHCLTLSRRNSIN